MAFSNFFLVLSFSFGQHRGAKIYAEYLGAGMRRDGRSISRPDAKGEKDTMEDALVSARITPDQVDLVLSHATGTGKGDIAESEALQEIFTGKKPAVSATKGAVGHGLAFSGAFDSVNAITSLATNLVLPVRNLEEKIPTIAPFPISRSVQLKTLQTALVHGLGLGGEDSAIVFSKKFLPFEHLKRLHDFQV
jgi:3-oxoacyl-[acyl-carrier-protein] synthase II